MLPPLPDTAPLPTFSYHPDPVATGMIAPSEKGCDACHRRTGWSYTGTVYAVDEIETICPWCISSGHAAVTFEATLAGPEQG